MPFYTLIGFSFNHRLAMKKIALMAAIVVCTSAFAHIPEGRVFEFSVLPINCLSLTAIYLSGTLRRMKCGLTLTIRTSLRWGDVGR